MTPATLNLVGAALYGPLWQSELSRALGVSDRTVRRWVSGDANIPDISVELAALMQERIKELQALADRLEA